VYGPFFLGGGGWKSFAQKINEVVGTSKKSQWFNLEWDIRLIQI